MSKNRRTTYEGQWWSPDEPDKKFLGTLTFTIGRGLRLKLKVPENLERTSHESLKVIHGHDQHKKPITLFYCSWAGTSTSGGLTTLRYHPGYCFHGVHILRWSEAALDEVTVHFTDLEPWVNISGFSTKPKSDWAIEYDRPEEIEIPSSQGFTLILAASVSQHIDREMQSISEGWLMRLEYKRACAFRTVRRHLLKLRQFLMLAAQRSVFKTSFVARRKVDPEKLGRIWRGRDITCFTPGMDREDSNADRKRSVDLLFTFGDVRSQFSAILAAWLKYSITFSDTLSLYFSCLENKHLYGNHQILFLAQALEVYHRTHIGRYKQAVETKAEFRKRRKRLTANLSQEDAKWLTDKLQWANQPTLNERLLEIFESKRALLGDFIGDERAFASRIKELRNHYTHYTSKKKKEELGHPPDCFELCYKMRIVLQVCFLSDIGMPEHIVKKLVRKFNWTVVRYTEQDEDEDHQHASVPPLRLKAPSRRPRRTKKREPHL